MSLYSISTLSPSSSRCTFPSPTRSSISKIVEDSTNSHKYFNSGTQIDSSTSSLDSEELVEYLATNGEEIELSDCTVSDVEEEYFIVTQESLKESNLDIKEQKESKGGIENLKIFYKSMSNIDSNYFGVSENSSPLEKLLNGELDYIQALYNINDNSLDEILSKILSHKNIARSLFFAALEKDLDKLNIEIILALLMNFKEVKINNFSIKFSSILELTLKKLEFLKKNRHFTYSHSTLVSIKVKFKEQLTIINNEKYGKYINEIERRISFLQERDSI